MEVFFSLAFGGSETLFPLKDVNKGSFWFPEQNILGNKYTINICY